jgi:hypothetical protein
VAKKFPVLMHGGSPWGLRGSLREQLGCSASFPRKPSEQSRPRNAYGKPSTVTMYVGVQKGGSTGRRCRSTGRVTAEPGEGERTRTWSTLSCGNEHALLMVVSALSSSVRSRLDLRFSAASRPSSSATSEACALTDFAARRAITSVR